MSDMRGTTCEWSVYLDCTLRSAHIRALHGDSRPIHKLPTARGWRGAGQRGVREDATKILLAISCSSLHRPCPNESQPVGCRESPRKKSLGWTSDEGVLANPNGPTCIPLFIKDRNFTSRYQAEAIPQGMKRLMTLESSEQLSQKHSSRDRPAALPIGASTS